jgi:hypothetical protein
VAALARWARDVIVMGEREDGELFETLLPDGARVRAWLTPPARPGAGPARPAPAPAERFPEPEPAPAFQPWNAPPREPAPAAASAALPTAEEAAAAPASALPVPEPQWEEGAPIEGGKRRKKRSIPKERRVSPLTLVLLVLLFIVIVAAASVWFFKPGLLLGGAAAPRAAQPSAIGAAKKQPAAASVPVAAAGTPRPYAVFVKAFQAYDAAKRLADKVQADNPGVPVYVFPEPNGAVTYYKVYAGMLDDTAQAAVLRQKLVDAGTVNPADVGGPAALIQMRPLAFDLGDYPSRDAAESRAAQLSRAAIDPYPVAVPLAGGGWRWRLYAGAFADSASAQAMKKQIEQAGLPARMVRREGDAPAAQK